MRIVRYYPRAIDGDGGMTGAVRRWAETCSQLGAQTDVVYRADPTTASRPPDDGLNWVPLRHESVGGLDVPRGLGPHLRGADLLVLHSGWTSHNVAAAATARNVGVPYLLEPRGAYDPHIVHRRRATKAVWWTLSEHRMVTHAAAVHLFFRQEQPHLEQLGYDGSFVVAPNGVTVPADATWDGGSGGFVLWLGRFDPEHKGLDLLVKALHAIPPRCRPQLRLHGPDFRGGKQTVRELVASLGLDDHVAIGEPVRGAAKLAMLARARAFVYPSRWEAFGNSVAEAAAMGLPIVTTRYPLGAELAAHDAAIACDPCPEALAAGLLRALEPDASCLGAAARGFAERSLGWPHVARTWLKQVEAVL